MVLYLNIISLFDFLLKFVDIQNIPSALLSITASTLVQMLFNGIFKFHSHFVLPLVSLVKKMRRVK